MTGIVRAGERRRIQTPNAVMTTLASPKLGASAGLAMWQVEMASGAQGPAHVFDSEQLYTVLEGTVSVAVAGEAVEIRAGDTLVLPAGVERRITAATAARMLVCGHGDAVVRVPGEDAPRGTPPWIA